MCTNKSQCLFIKWSIPSFWWVSLQFRLRKLIFILHSSRYNISANFSIRVTYSILLQGIKKNSPIYSTANKIKIRRMMTGLNKPTANACIFVLLYIFLFSFFPSYFLALFTFLAFFIFCSDLFFSNSSFFRKKIHRKRSKLAIYLPSFWTIAKQSRAEHGTKFFDLNTYTLYWNDSFAFQLWCGGLNRVFWLV